MPARRGCGFAEGDEHFYGLRKRPTPERVSKMSKAWQGWRSYATFYLWLTYWENAEWKQQARKAIRAQPIRPKAIPSAWGSIH